MITITNVMIMNIMVIAIIMSIGVAGSGEPVAQD
jgi:hypothetical protein